MSDVRNGGNCASIEQTINMPELAGLDDLDIDQAEVPSADADDIASIRALNDRLRCEGIGGVILMTSGVSDLPEVDRQRVVAAARAFNAFNEDNDPYGEHDFGLLDVQGRRFIWKIDAYDESMTMGSPNPSDPDQTCRVLTIMFANEY